MTNYGTIAAVIFVTLIFLLLSISLYKMVSHLWQLVLVATGNDNNDDNFPFFEYPCDDESGTFKNLRTIYHGDFQNDYSDWVDGLLELQRESGQASMAEGFCENQMGYMFLFYLENEGLIEINRDKLRERCGSR